jgi:hypothetical protein
MSAERFAAGHPGQGPSGAEDTEDSGDSGRGREGINGNIFVYTYKRNRLPE